MRLSDCQLVRVPSQVLPVRVRLHDGGDGVPADQDHGDHRRGRAGAADAQDHPGGRGEEGTRSVCCRLGVSDFSEALNSVAGKDSAVRSTRFGERRRRHLCETAFQTVK